MNARMHPELRDELGAQGQNHGSPAARAFGKSMPRKEDERLLRGDGKFVDDVQYAHQFEMAVLRCPFPHARIRSVDTEAARAARRAPHPDRQVGTRPQRPTHRSAPGAQCT
jgi:carbon-monoxide dehydrogenase large subunit